MNHINNINDGNKNNLGISFPIILRDMLMIKPGLVNALKSKKSQKSGSTYRFLSDFYIGNDKKINIVFSFSNEFCYNALVAVNTTTTRTAI